MVPEIDGSTLAAGIGLFGSGADGSIADAVEVVWQ